MSLKGNQYLEPVIQAGYPERTKNADGSWTNKYLYHIANNLAESNIPTSSTATDQYGKKFLTARIKENGASPGVAILELVYGDPDKSGGMGSEVDGTLIYESDCSFEERPIEEHPDYKAATTDEEKNALRKEYGNSFLYIPVTFRKTTVLNPSHVEMTEATILRDVGVVQKPSGLKNATEDNWAKISRRIRQNKNNYEVVDEWMYDADGWKTKLHFNNSPTT